MKIYEKRKGLAPVTEDSVLYSAFQRENWRMPAMENLAPVRLSLSSRMWMLVLRGYLAIAAGLLIVKLVTLAVAG